MTEPFDLPFLDQFTLYTEGKWLGDDPTSHFWRATFFSTYVHLIPYPVIRRTEHGVWIDPDTVATLEAAGPAVRPKFMIVGSHKSWAKPTRELAIASLLYRTVRRAERVRKEAELIRSFARAVPTLFPEDAKFSRLIFLALGDKL